MDITVKTQRDEGKVDLIIKEPTTLFQKAIMEEGGICRSCGFYGPCKNVYCSIHKRYVGPPQSAKVKARIAARKNKRKNFTNVSYKTGQTAI